MKKGLIITAIVVVLLIILFMILRDNDSTSSQQGGSSSQNVELIPELQVDYQAVDCGGGFKGPNKEECEANRYMTEARQTKNMSTCDKVSDKYRDACKQDVVILVSVEKQSLDPCNDLAADKVQQCRANVAQSLALQTEDDKWCDELEGDAQETCKQRLEGGPFGDLRGGPRAPINAETSAEGEDDGIETEEDTMPVEADVAETSVEDVAQ